MGLIEDSTTAVIAMLDIPITNANPLVTWVRGRRRPVKGAESLLDPWMAFKDSDPLMA